MTMPEWVKTSGAPACLARERRSGGMMSLVARSGSSNLPGRSSNALAALALACARSAGCRLCFPSKLLKRRGATL